MSAKDNATDIGTLEPTAVWRFFAGIAATPRPSKKEERIRQHIKTVATDLGLSVREDSVGNQVIDVPATPGFENVPITVLQAHLDMVCVKDGDGDHDFDRDPIALQVVEDPKGAGQIVCADRTTLGADNGIGVAMALAAASSPEVTHGPLELLFTVDEEAGMSGAKALTSQSFKGRRLLNLDSEEDDALYIGCAGGCDTNLSFECALHPPDDGGEWCRVAVSGLRGGHSGGDIHENRANAIKLLVRTLQRAEPNRLRIATIRGGSLRNAIPREAEAIVWGPAGVRKALLSVAEQVRGEAIDASAEHNASIRVGEVANGDVRGLLGAEDTQRLLDALAALPYGVLGMHPKVEGLVETSNNVGTVSTTDASDGRSVHVRAETLSRSSSASQLQSTLDQIAAIGRLGGACVETGNEYPGWEPDLDSPVLATCRRVYEGLFGEPPNVTAIHAGLECGIIGKLVGGMDTISFGPRITGAHSPEECVYVSSVQKSWKYLTAVLAELARC